jgi:hypothetical protein
LKLHAGNLSDDLTTRRVFLQRAVVLGGGVWLTLPVVGCSTLKGARREAWQIGCYTRPWDQFDYRTALDGIAEAGFEYAGIMTAKTKTWLVLTKDSSLEEAAEVGTEVRKRGLKCLSLVCRSSSISVPLAVHPI